jgi:hypothetical protein
VAGYRNFLTGEVLTAANVNDFLMEQSVMTFADGTARDTALAAVLREGLTVYNEAVGLHQVYDGAAWVPVGGLVAVKSALFTGTQSASVLAGDNVAVTNLSITHTLADAANKLIISAYFGAAGHSEQQGQTGLAVADDGTLIAIGDAVGSRTQVGAGGITSVTTSTANISMPSVTFVYEPGDAVAHTYTVRAVNIRNDTKTLFINRSEADTNSQSLSRTTSGLVIQEVKV